MKKYLLHLFIILILFSGCTFDYGGNETGENNHPEIVMYNVEYVRVRSADPFARIQAEHFERYDRQNMMKIQEITFEQYGENGEEINIYGTAGNASVNIESGDVFLDNDVNIEIKTENMILETRRLEWFDESRDLFSGKNDEVNIYMENGTRLTGTGLQANTRTRSWEFQSNARGVYVHDEEDE